METTERIFTSDISGKPIEIGPRQPSYPAHCEDGVWYCDTHGLFDCDRCTTTAAPDWLEKQFARIDDIAASIGVYRYTSPIGDTEPTGLQAAARLAGEQNAKVAALVLAATTAAGQMKILEDHIWDHTRNYDPIYDSEKVRAELLSAIQELAS